MEGSVVVMGGRWVKLKPPSQLSFDRKQDYQRQIDLLIFRRFPLVPDSWVPIADTVMLFWNCSALHTWQCHSKKYQSSQSFLKIWILHSPYKLKYFGPMKRSPLIQCISEWGVMDPQKEIYKINTVLSRDLYLWSGGCSRRLNSWWSCRPGWFGWCSPYHIFIFYFIN